jgi:hypothetical protein
MRGWKAAANVWSVAEEHGAARRSVALGDSLEVVLLQAKNKRAPRAIVIRADRFDGATWSVDWACSKFDLDTATLTTFEALSVAKP